MSPVLKISQDSAEILHFCWNLTKIGHFGTQSKPLILAKFTIMGHFEPLWCEMIWKSWKTQNNLLMFHPFPMEWNFLRFLQKWDTLVVKDGKSCESGEIGHSESIWAWFWGKKMEKPAKWPKLAILSQSKPLFLAKFAISIEILLRYLSFHQFWS